MPDLDPCRPRRTYLDFLRILAAFLVIVNHTVKVMFRTLSPAEPVWWLSVAWYYVSKMSVPLYVMVSGACLLPRQDSYRKALGRFGRILIVLLVFSYGYYLVNLWETYWTWQKALDLPAFLAAVWQGDITYSFWYLYFYLGLMLMLPFLQKLASAMKKRDIEVYLALSLTFFGVWPLVAHYVPALSLPPYFDLSLYGILLGLFFLGHYLNTYAGAVRLRVSLPVLGLSLAASTALTALEVHRVAAGADYLFMDSRTSPMICIVVATMATVMCARRIFDVREPLPARAARRWAALGGCSFGMYLMQELVIRETRHRYFDPLSAATGPVPAMLIWETGILAVTLCLAWLMKRLPWLKKIL